MRNGLSWRLPSFWCVPRDHWISKNNGNWDFQKNLSVQKTEKKFSCRRKNHPTPGTLSNQLSVTWEARRENLNLPGPVNYATQNRRPCPRTGIFFCKATPRRTGISSRRRRSIKTRTPPKHALARAVEYTALGADVRAEARPIAHFLFFYIKEISFTDIWKSWISKSVKEKNHDFWRKIWKYHENKKILLKTPKLLSEVVSLDRLTYRLFVGCSCLLHFCSQSNVFFEVRNALWYILFTFDCETSRASRPPCPAGLVLV